MLLHHFGNSCDASDIAFVPQSMLLRLLKSSIKHSRTVAKNLPVKDIEKRE